MVFSRRKVLTAAAALVVGLPALAACGDDSGAEAGGGKKTTVTLGYFPNITHATALVGVNKGIFAQKLGANVDFKSTTFNAGPAAIEALFAKGVDATFIGPNPAINAWAKSKGQALKIISGAASGGVSFVVNPEKVKDLNDLKGKKIATPQLGNTQDVALRYYLKKEKNLTANRDGSGDVKVVPQENAQTIETFKSGEIDGAWVPEPFASRLILENGAKKLLDEKDLWPSKQFVITHLIVRQEFAKDHPDLVKALVEASVESTTFINDHQADAKKIVNDQITALTQKSIKPDVLDAAFKEITFTNDPIASSLTEGAAHAQEIGLLDKVDLNGIYDLSILNGILKAAGKPEATS